LAYRNIGELGRLQALGIRDRGFQAVLRGDSAVKACETMGALPASHGVVRGHFASVRHTMADTVESLVLEQLRLMRAEQAALRDDVREVKNR
jgi:hypothetical protein